MNLVILGGGTAGWITALYMRALLPQSKITLIQNSTIGIVGVGEATTPNFIDYLKIVNIDYKELIKHSDATIKLGISFENWNGDNQRYFHPFSDRITSFKRSNAIDDDSIYSKFLMNYNYDFNESIYCNKLAYNNKIDLEHCAFAMHFNSNALSHYLQLVGKERSIDIIEGTFQTVTTNEQGFITSIVLDEDRSILCDFVFDCSGFSRLLIGNHFKEFWISYKQHLPVKKAIPFWLDLDNDTKPYTTATAMKYGWIWQTPLQSRIGAGYVFDSDYISVDQALDEAEMLFGRELEVRKVLDFEAGRYNNFWVKNCCAFGLSSSFIEPLESTSIFSTINQLILFTNYIQELSICDEISIRSFNKLITNSVDNIRNFVYFHYLTKRNDSEFWKEFKLKNLAPKEFIPLLEALRIGKTSKFDFTKTIGSFYEFSFMHVGHGIKFFDQLPRVSGVKITPSVNQYKTLVNEYYKNYAKSHLTFIESLL